MCYLKRCVGSFIRFTQQACLFEELVGIRPFSDEKSLNAGLSEMSGA